MAVTPFARSVEEVGLTAKVAPEPPLARPFQAGQEGATGRQLNRALEVVSKMLLEPKFFNARLVENLYGTNYETTSYTDGGASDATPGWKQGMKKMWHNKDWTQTEKERIAYNYLERVE